jgi:hypothetical protein
MSLATAQPALSNRLHGLVAAERQFEIAGPSLRRALSAERAPLNRHSDATIAAEARRAAEALEAAAKYVRASLAVLEG